MKQMCEHNDWFVGAHVVLSAGVHSIYGSNLGMQ